MKNLVFIFTVFLFAAGNAQQSANSSGGSISGSNGKIDYSVGQVFYNYKTSGTVSMLEGVQQPFEISTLGTDDYPGIKLEMVVYPNPTANDITLKIEGKETQKLNYRLLDMSGKLLSQKKVESVDTHIQMNAFSSGTYLLIVSEDSKVIKTFKIIKN